jgi:hypothetical protein
MEVAPNQEASIHFSLGKKDQNHELGTGFFVHFTAFVYKKPLLFL